jgi:acyl-coenzyme A thioesterase PaaI-like protein
MKQKIKNKQNNSKMCFVCGMENDFGLKASFFELENDQLIATFQPCKFHQGYPGRLHGGIASTILDEAMGRAILIKDDNIWGVTIELTVKFKKPIPLNENLKVVCNLTKDSSRIFEGEGKIVLENGETAVTAEGKYFKLALDKITKEDFVDDQWFKVESENDPKEIDL